MKYSPKLRQAMTQIKAIMQRHDIGGLVVLHTPGYGEFNLKINPSYSCAKFTPDGKGIAVSTKYLKVGKEQKQKILSDTVNMLDVIGDLGGKLSLNTMQVLEMIAEHVDIDYDEGTITGQNEIDN